ncbi:MAG TPA: hypothetical protein VHN20_09235 [Beijerinckiaceae bacterium]|nr:hypothetical protein [Beijerinckiaceae bacterium]
MCGDLEEEQRGEEQLYGRFRLHARELLRGRGTADAPPTAKDLNAYMDRLFADALARCARDGEQAADGDAYRLLAAQPLVFARLAGFLAAHVSLQEDPLRKVMEALMHGYAEAEHIEPDHHGHDHDHDHDDHHDHHHHGHAHHHGHEHH